jgi:hypothetical protein
MYNVHKHRKNKKNGPVVKIKTFLPSILVHSKCITSVNSWQTVSTYVRGSWCKIFSEILFKYVINTVVWNMWRSWKHQKPDQQWRVKLFCVFYTSFEYIWSFPVWSIFYSYHSWIHSCYMIFEQLNFCIRSKTVSSKSSIQLWK